jgi:hypothetical protein
LINSAIPNRALTAAAVTAAAAGVGDAKSTYSDSNGAFQIEFATL